MSAGQRVGVVALDDAGFLAELDAIGAKPLARGKVDVICSA